MKVSVDSATCKGGFTARCKRIGHMVQCPTHPDVHFRPGNECHTCEHEKTIGANRERDAREQDKKNKKEQEDSEWYTERPGRREDKPRKNKPKKCGQVPHLDVIHEEDGGEGHEERGGVSRPHSKELQALEY